MKYPSPHVVATVADEHAVAPVGHATQVVLTVTNPVVHVLAQAAVVLAHG